MRINAKQKHAQRNKMIGWPKSDRLFCSEALMCARFESRQCIVYRGKAPEVVMHLDENRKKKYKEGKNNAPTPALFVFDERCSIIPSSISQSHRDSAVMWSHYNSFAPWQNLRTLNGDIA